MKKNLLIAIAAAAIGGIIYLLTRKKDGSGSPVNMGVAGSGMPTEKVDVPAQYDGYDEDEGWWQAIDRGMKLYLGFSDTDKKAPDGLSYHGLVMGFFKAADIEPSTAAVRHFKNKIKDWFVDGGIRHWEIEGIGVLR